MLWQEEQAPSVPSAPRWAGFPLCNDGVTSWHVFKYAFGGRLGEMGTLSYRINSVVKAIWSSSLGKCNIWCRKRERRACGKHMRPKLWLRKNSQLQTGRGVRWPTHPTSHAEANRDERKEQSESKRKKPKNWFFMVVMENVMFSHLMIMINRLNLSFCSCGQVCASQCPDSRTHTRLFSSSCRSAGMTTTEINWVRLIGFSTALAWHQLISISLFFPPFSAVKTRIIPTARSCPTSWRWLSRLMSSCRGEPSVRFPRLTFLESQEGSAPLRTHVLTSRAFLFKVCLDQIRSSSRRQTGRRPKATWWSGTSGLKWNTSMR